MRIFLFLIYFLSWSWLPAQIIYSSQFTKKLDRIGLEFVEPVEGYYKVKMLRKDDFFKYDMVLHSEDKELEMRFALDPRYKQAIPHIAFFNMSTSLATNEQRFNIKLNVYPFEEAKSIYGADWAAYSDFIPKRSLTSKFYARLITLFSEEKGIVHQLILFNRHDAELEIRSHTIAFEKSVTDPN